MTLYLALFAPLERISENYLKHKILRKNILLDELLHYSKHFAVINRSMYWINLGLN